MLPREALWRGEWPGQAPAGEWAAGAQPQGDEPKPADGAWWLPEG